MASARADSSSSRFREMTMSRVLRPHSVRPPSVQNWTASVICAVRTVLVLPPVSWTSCRLRAYFFLAIAIGGGSRRAPGELAVIGIVNAIV
jgi:hypothetical protein